MEDDLMRVLTQNEIKDLNDGFWAAELSGHISSGLPWGRIMVTMNALYDKENSMPSNEVEAVVSTVLDAIEEPIRQAIVDAVEHLELGDISEVLEKMDDAIISLKEFLGTAHHRAGEAHTEADNAAHSAQSAAEYAENAQYAMDDATTNADELAEALSELRNRG